MRTNHPVTLHFHKLADNKIFFAEKTFVDCSLVPPKDATPPNFTKKTFANSHKTSKFVNLNHYMVIKCRKGIPNANKVAIRMIKRYIYKALSIPASCLPCLHIFGHLNMLLGICVVMLYGFHHNYISYVATVPCKCRRLCDPSRVF